MVDGKTNAPFGMLDIWSWYWDKTNISGILSGARFFSINSRWRFHTCGIMQKFQDILLEHFVNLNLLEIVGDNLSHIFFL